jgi:hypothetical protein
MIAMSMRCIGQRAMFYLAAAVSDYYVSSYFHESFEF